MKYTIQALSTFVAVGVLALVPAVGQGPAKGKAGAYVPPKTAWGDPDMQGLWPGSVNIPLQRPESMGSRDTLTAEEVKKKDEDSKKRVANGNWIEFYPASTQGSLVVEPKSGRLPAMTPEATRRNKAVRGGLGPPSLGGVEIRSDSWEDFDLWGRCITKGLVGSMLPGNLYNKGNRVVQAPGLFVIQNEMVHESRVIPIVPGGKNAHVGPKVRTYMGDGRGHWEGHALVVETTNFKKDIGMNGINFALLTEELKISERFERIGPDKMSYDAKIEDPGTWTSSWTMHVPFTMDTEYELYEYACHEANYGLLDILKGARREEQLKK